MIDPQCQWAIQIEVTNACTRACSNCTRFVGHHPKPFFVTVDEFRRDASALSDFPSQSPPAVHSPLKVVGMIGGEPLLHPQFAELAEIMADEIPDHEHRGLWTGLRWESTKYADLIRRTFGVINNNRHDSECRHSPILVAVADVIEDPFERQRLIDDCWLQRTWSATITPRGFFFCEVAGSLDLLFDGPGGLLVEPGCWRRPLADFQEQIDWACNRCGIPLNMRGRIDHEDMDDVSRTNLEKLADSPRVKAGQYVLHDRVDAETVEQPWRYLQ